MADIKAFKSYLFYKHCSIKENISAVRVSPQTHPFATPNRNFNTTVDPLFYSLVLNLPVPSLESYHSFRDSTFTSVLK